MVSDLRREREFVVNPIGAEFMRGDQGRYTVSEGFSGIPALTRRRV
jgi:hypothetical protein